MIDTAMIIQGNLFSRDFLLDGIRRTPEWLALDDASVDNLKDDLVAIFRRLPLNRATSESQTEDELIWPVLERLDWIDWLRQQNLAVRGRDDVPDGLLFANAGAKVQANKFDETWKRYQHGLVLVESKRWGRPLDRRTGGRSSGEEVTAPSTQMLRYLRRADDITGGKLRWGMLTNGARWRLYFQGARSISEEFFELDLAHALQIVGYEGGLFALSAEEQRHWLRVFLVVFSRGSFLPSPGVGTTFHQRALELGRFYEEHVAANLSTLVFQDVFPKLVRAIAGAAPSAALSEVRDASLILLYRLLFILYAEDRDLLPVRDARYDNYSLRDKVRLDVGRRKGAGDTFSETASRYWAVIDDLCRAIDKGDGSIGLPPYNGGLFDQQRTPLLTTFRLGDAVIADVIDALSFDHSSGERKYINYRDLSVRQLGSIYERLLEHEVRRKSGSLEIRPNIFARKGSGSYYTPDDLVVLIIQRTIEPLIAEKMSAFRDKSEELAKRRDSAAVRRATLATLDPATQILALRICDPAMGSGHFLVALVDYLTDQVIAAVAESEKVGEWAEYVSPLGNRIEDIRNTIFKNATDNNWSLDFDQLDDRHIIRRMVLKRCVYGVDKNPMAVELSKVSLWLHTFTVGAPLSFLDHHLRCGDSLFGSWVRAGMDRASALGAPLLLHGPTTRAMRAAASMQIIEGLTDAEIAEAHRSKDVFDEVYEMTSPLNAFLSLVHAFDWLNIRGREDRAALAAYFDGQFGDPVQISLGAEPSLNDRTEGSKFAEILTKARRLVREEGFLNWQVAFPGVWSSWESAERGGGFDAIIGNPPWDRLKLQEVEWWAARKPEIARAETAAKRKTLIKSSEKSDPSLAADFNLAVERAEAASRVARSGPDYPLLSGGDTNLNSLFIERAHALVKPGGMIGLLVPSGIASDQSSANFFRKLTDDKRLACVIDFFNKRADGTLFFPDVYYRFKFCAYVAGGLSRRFAQISFGFFVRDLEELNNPDRVFAVSSEDVARINPNSRTAPILRSRRDAELALTVYRKFPVLVDRSHGDESRSWPVRYVRMFDMANDSELFRTEKELEEKEGAWRLEGDRWRSALGDWLPLYEGKMVQAYDHRASDIVLADQNLFRTGQGSELTVEDHLDPGRTAKSRYWVQAASLRWDAQTEWCIAIKDVTSVTNARTTIATLIPRVAAGHTLPVIFPAPDGGSECPSPPYSEFAVLVLANLNCVVLDYLSRQKVHGNHLAWYLIEQLPLLSKRDYRRKFGSKSAEEIVREVVLELTYTSNDMAPFARDMNYLDADGDVKSPFLWDERRRLSLRAKLDALYFHLYGIVDREQIRYIYSTFPVVERDEQEQWGKYASRDLCLSWMNALGADMPDENIELLI
ncbi:restriction endonuclease [Bradyrhizobium sp. CSA207]|uniref:Eco57I restriction-modification methylase domain-containing protein n=1 Tax=Bradyrhizobium sp. CSA207 TaxID=2698826 RepID=UPI0023B08545|nr:hypothetical protein [Bradyrhizobium sp. CSA207]MDE5442897.1 restriction endonuclease [Bradyrhizobium sp. CSA207]